MYEINRCQIALFLDFDGTLVNFADDPESVTVSAELRSLLLDLQARLEGALAIISGRSIESLNSLLQLSQITLAGGHGAEWMLLGEYHAVHLNSAHYPIAVERLEKFARKYDLLTENKQHSFALHFRQQPQLKQQVDEFICEYIGPLDELRVIYGNCVREIQPIGMDKGKAVERFMRLEPFVGKKPVYIGDDTTDEDAFQWVNANQGVSYKVGKGMTAAQARLENVAAVTQFLRELANPH